MYCELWPLEFLKSSLDPDRRRITSTKVRRILLRSETTMFVSMPALVFGITCDKPHPGEGP